MLGVSFTYSVEDYYRTPAPTSTGRHGPAMSGWAIASIIGALLGTLIVVLLVVIAKAVRRTGENAIQLMEALNDVRERTIVLADLEASTERTSRVVEEAAAAIREAERLGRDDDHGPTEP